MKPIITMLMLSFAFMTAAWGQQVNDTDTFNQRSIQLQCQQGQFSPGCD